MLLPSDLWVSVPSGLVWGGYACVLGVLLLPVSEKSYFTNTGKQCTGKQALLHLNLDSSVHQMHMEKCCLDSDRIICHGSWWTAWILSGYLDPESALQWQPYNCTFEALETSHVGSCHACCPHIQRTPTTSSHFQMGYCWRYYILPLSAFLPLFDLWWILADAAMAQHPHLAYTTEAHPGPQ